MQLVIEWKVGAEAAATPDSQLSSVQSLSRVRLFVTPWTAAHQASVSIINFRSLPKLMSIESVMPSSHLILCRPLLRLPSIFPSIRVFSNESVLFIRWPKYWSFSFNISASHEYSGLISFRMDWFNLLKSKGLLRVFSNTSVQFSSVIQSCLTLCDPVNFSTIGLAVHHQIWSLLKLISIQLKMPSNHLILCCPILL